jgi:hypothetical protein
VKAIKTKLKMDDSRGAGAIAALREASLLREMQHPCVVQVWCEILVSRMMYEGGVASVFEHVRLLLK